MVFGSVVNQDLEKARRNQEKYPPIYCDDVEITKEQPVNEQYQRFLIDLQSNQDEQ